MKTLSDELYKQFSDFLEAQSGIVLGTNKQYLVKSRLAPLLGHLEPSLSDLIKRSMDPRERELKMTVVDARPPMRPCGFKDIYPFQLLTDKIFPELGKKWVAAR